MKIRNFILVLYSCFIVFLSLTGLSHFNENNSLLFAKNGKMNESKKENVSGDKKLQKEKISASKISEEVSIDFEMYIGVRFIHGDRPPSEVKASFMKSGLFEFYRPAPPRRMKGRYEYDSKTWMLKIKYDTDDTLMIYKLTGNKHPLRFQLVIDGGESGSFIELIPGG